MSAAARSPGTATVARRSPRARGHGRRDSAGRKRVRRYLARDRNRAPAAADHNGRRMLLVGRRRQHADPLRGVPRARSCVEHWRFATVRQSTADELGAALRSLLELRGYGFEQTRRLDRLLDRAPAGARVDRDGEPLPRARDARRRPGDQDRHGDPLRQPARDRRRPARQRRRRCASASAARRSASTSARRPPSTSSRATASTSAGR